MRFILTLLLFLPLTLNGQCTNAPNGQWPSNTINVSCSDSWTNINSSWTGEYSLIEVQQGYTYEFDAYICVGFFCFSQVDYFVTITDFSGTLIYTSQLTLATDFLVWQAPFSGTIRFYSHLSSACNFNTQNSVRRFRCIGQSLNVNKFDYKLNCDTKKVTIEDNTHPDLFYTVSRDGVVFENLIKITDNFFPLPNYDYIKIQSGNTTVATFFNICDRPIYYIKQGKLYINKNSQRMAIYNTSGALVLDISEQVVDINHLSQGVYYLRLDNEIFKMVISQ